MRCSLRKLRKCNIELYIKLKYYIISIPHVELVLRLDIQQCMRTWNGYLLAQGMVPPPLLTISAHLMRLNSIKPLFDFFCWQKMRLLFCYFCTAINAEFMHHTYNVTTSFHLWSKTACGNM